MKQLLSLESFEPHRVKPHDLVGTLRPMPAAWWRTSPDVLSRLMFYAKPGLFGRAKALLEKPA